MPGKLVVVLGVGYSGTGRMVISGSMLSTKVCVAMMIGICLIAADNCFSCWWKRRKGDDVCEFVRGISADGRCNSCLFGLRKRRCTIVCSVSRSRFREMPKKTVRGMELYAALSLSSFQE